MKNHSNSGFSLIEVLIVVAIAIVLAGMAIPVFMTAMNNYRLSAAVSAATGAVEAARFQAIMHGCPYEVVFTSATLTYQLNSEVPAVGTVGCLPSFAAVGTPIPLPSAGPITMPGAATFTYTLCPNGTVFGAPVNTPCPGTVLPPTMQIANAVKSYTIAVTGVGNVSTSNP